MTSLASLFSASGQIAPRPFALGVIFVYALSFVSQVLLSPPVTARGGILPFVIAQAALTWVWFALHAKRLRAAGRPAGAALGIAVLYALAVVLLMLLLEPIISPGMGATATAAPRFNPLELWAFLLLFAALIAQSSPGFFDYLAWGILALAFMPMAIAVGFSIWVGTRPAAAAPPRTS